MERLMQTEKPNYVKVSKYYGHKGMMVSLPKRRTVFSDEIIIRDVLKKYMGLVRPRIFVSGKRRFGATEFVLPWSYFDTLLEHYFIPEFGECLLMVETKVTGKKCSESCQGANMSSKCNCACGRTNHGGAVDRFGNLQLGMVVTNEEESLVMNYKWYEKEFSSEDSLQIAELIEARGGSVNPDVIEVNVI